MRLPDDITYSRYMCFGKLWELLMDRVAGILWPIWLQRIRQDWVIELNWTIILFFGSLISMNWHLISVLLPKILCVVEYFKFCKLFILCTHLYIIVDSSTDTVVIRLTYRCRYTIYSQIIWSKNSKFWNFIIMIWLNKVCFILTMDNYKID